MGIRRGEGPVPTQSFRELGCRRQCHLQHLSSKITLEDKSQKRCVETSRKSKKQWQWGIEKWKVRQSRITNFEWHFLSLWQKGCSNIDLCRWGASGRHTPMTSGRQTPTLSSWSFPGHPDTLLRDFLLCWLLVHPLRPQRDFVSLSRGQERWFSGSEWWRRVLGSLYLCTEKWPISRRCQMSINRRLTLEPAGDNNSEVEVHPCSMCSEPAINTYMVLFFL